MCWSLEVSALFSAIDVSLLTFLYYRNKPNDRLFALFALPVALQEILQIVIWANIGTDPYSCNAVNVWATLAARLIVFMIPLTGTILGVFCTNPNEKGQEDHFTSKLKKPLLILAALYSFSMDIAFIVGFNIYPTQGTVAGPNHHQVWPYYWEKPYTETSFLSFALYVIPAIIPIWIYLRPIWLSLGLTVPIVVLALIFRSLYPIEYESIWCWSGFVILAFAVFQVYFHPKDNQYAKLAQSEEEGLLEEETQ